MVHISIGLALLGALSACTNASPLRKSTPTVKLGSDDQVLVQGTSAHNVESFLNIRFGENTAGNNRFAAPKPFHYPSGTVVNGTAVGAACPQQTDFGSVLFDTIPVSRISEDCLSLRVDRPAHTNSSAKLPVMVWIYGGGDSIGQIYDGAYDPSGLVINAAQKGSPVIYVAMNYRVGIFGFAASPALNETDSLNAGLLDQRLALEWVQKNIAAFGGDPDNVTIFGESDGATGVGLQVTAYGGKDPKVPFKRAIMESGSPGADKGVTTGDSLKHTAALIKIVGCSASSSEAEIACLRKLPLAKLLPIAVKYELTLNSYTFGVFKPVAPSKFIPDSPSKLLASGRFARNIDMIAGWAENDDAFFTDPYINADNATEAAAETFGRKNVTDKATLAELHSATKQVLELYPLSDFPAKLGETSYFYRASQMSRDVDFVCPSLYAITMNHKYSNSSSNYVYALNQTAFTQALEQSGLPFFQVPHFSDIPYVFNQIKTRFASVDNSTADARLGSEISASWASFATSGDPTQGRGTLPHWSSAMGSNGQLSVQVIGGPTPGARSIGTEKSFEKLMKRCSFWNSEKIQTLMGI